MVYVMTIKLPLKMVSRIINKIEMKEHLSEKVYFPRQYIDHYFAKYCL